VGFDTEQGPLARARFRRMRIGRAANSFEATLLATFRQQTAETRFQWHVLKDLASPFRLIPLLAYDRESEHQYQTSTLRGGILAATEWERPEFQLGLEAGPTLEHTTTLRGLGRRHVTTAKTNATLRGTSHLFEYYAAHPRTGWSFQVDTSSRIAGFLSHVTVHRLTLRHEWLWNWRQFDPPALIIGWRGFWGTFTARRAETLLDIPVSDRFFLGGDADIRGFGRKTIGGATNGLLSAVYQGIELRAGEWGMYPVQPLVFFDFAKGGAGEFSLGSTVYYAPGIGVRYASPIGSVRATLGRGFIADRRGSDPDPGLQFFFSLGREF
jgi:translocation and assembly module TamA